MQERHVSGADEEMQNDYTFSVTFEDMGFAAWHIIGKISHSERENTSKLLSKLLLVSRWWHPMLTHKYLDNCYDSEAHFGLISGQNFYAQGWNVIVRDASC